MIRFVLTMAVLASPVVVSGQGDPGAFFGAWLPNGRLAAAGALADGARVAPEVPDEISAARCAPPGMPAMLDTAYPIAFIDRGDRIVMQFEEWDIARTIYVDPRNRPPVQEPSPAGVSFGRWSGDTLEVFTLYIDYPYFDRRGTPQSEDVTVFERYTPNAGLMRLDWEITVTDPSSFTAPVRTTGYSLRAMDAAPDPVDCGTASSE